MVMCKVILKANFVFLILLIFGLGCDKEKKETEETCDYEIADTAAAKLIIGRWVKIKVEDIPVEQNVFWEFGPDSLARWQSFENGVINTIYRKYWVDSLLHYNIDGGFPLTPWHFKFLDNCTLYVGNAFLALAPISYTFKRIEQ
jgi:hypothetical protein